MGTVKPADCAVAFALPTSEEDFALSLAQPHSDYVRRFKAAGWAQYASTCEHLRQSIGRYRACGVTQVHERLSLRDWPDLFNRAKVVILFAHWIDGDRPGEGAVELWDCRASPSQLLAGIPNNFDGVIDCSVCRPFELKEIVDRRRPHATVAIIPFNVHPVIWSEIYGTILEILQRFNVEYMETANKVVCEYRTQSLRSLRMSSNEVMRLYLERVGQLPLSPESVENAGSPIREPNAADTHFLQQMVSRQASVNLGVLALGLTLIVAVFVVAVIASAKSGNSPSSVFTALGIGGGAETGLLIWIFYLWREYNRFQFLLLLCQSQQLSATDVLKVVGEMHFAGINRKPRTTRKTNRAAAGNIDPNSI